MGRGPVAGLVCAEAPLASAGTKQGWMEQMSVQPTQAGLGRTAKCHCQLGLEEQGTDSHFFPSSTLSLTPRLYM